MTTPKLSLFFRVICTLVTNFRYNFAIVMSIELQLTDLRVRTNKNYE